MEDHRNCLLVECHHHPPIQHVTTLIISIHLHTNILIIILILSITQAVVARLNCVVCHVVEDVVEDVVVLVIYTFFTFILVVY